MKIVKKLILILGVLLGLLFVGGAFLPSEISLERSTLIAAPLAVVFDQVNDLKKNEAWSPWKARDATIVNTYSTPSSGPGAWYSWTSENSGTGKLTVVEVVENASIRQTLAFEGMGESETRWTFKETRAGIKTTWGFHQDLGWNLLGRYFGLMLDDMLAPDYVDGLARLKQVAEAARSPGP